MTLLDIIIMLIFVGVALYLINLIPMDGRIKQIINILIIIVVVLWLLRALGLFAALNGVRIR